ncbi:MAG: hypothetical protein RLY70_3206 [Planctomycetota bacterium]|jgi:hypothetical protein
MNRLLGHKRFARRDSVAAIWLLLSLPATNGCAVWDWMRPAANPNAAAPTASTRASGAIGDEVDPEGDVGRMGDESSRVAGRDDTAPDVATRFRPRAAARRSENLLLDERSRQIERNLGL